MRVFIAIDPGASGAIAVRDSDGRVFVDNMPDTLRDISDHIDSLVEVTSFKERQNCHVYLEDVGYHVIGNNASASAKFARHVGSIEGILTAFVFPWQAVRPQAWMKHFGTLPKDKKDRKNRIKELMQRRYPHIKVTLANADALAILTWVIEKQG